MQNSFEEIRDQIHEIRNLLGPFDLKLANLDHLINANRIVVEAKISELQSQVTGLSGGLTELLERVKWIESTLKVPQRPEGGSPLPVHEDKLSTALPPTMPSP